MTNLKKIFIAFIVCSLFATNFSYALDSIQSYKYPDKALLFSGADKWEGFNRKIFTFNLNANRYVIKPINTVWASVIPKYGMDRINNLYTNIKYPVRLFSSLFQGDTDSAGKESKRFLINTTIGIAGLYDPAKSKFKIEPCTEDMGQALAHHNVKQGPYLVLPIVTQGNVRDIGGQALDWAFNPCSYLFWLGPVSMISSGVSLVNRSAFMQPIYQMADNYPDSYVVAKELQGLERYMRQNNIDRTQYLTQDLLKEDNIVPIGDRNSKTAFKADIKLNDYNPQNKQADALRTMLFDTQKIGKNSAWTELSIWNRNFKKQLKTKSIRIDKKKDKYYFKYILQKDKNAPLAILYPSIGEGIASNQSAVFTKILYDKGYSVLILGSSFNWEFVKSMPDGFAPGIPNNDADMLRIVTKKAVEKIEKKHKRHFNKKILVGTSFGALTGLFVADKEKKDNTLGISRFVFVCPPIQMFYAMQQIDKFSQALVMPDDKLKEELAVTAKKIIEVTYFDYDKNNNGKVKLPLNEHEAQIVISYAMRLKLYNLLFVLENGSPSKKNDIYKKFNNTSFYDYAKTYLIKNQSEKEIANDSTLYTIKDFLKQNENYVIYHTANDCFVNTKQLAWLKKQTGNKTIIFDNGSHLGFLYRKEFLSKFLNEIKLELLN